MPTKALEHQEADLDVTFRTQKGTFTLSHETLDDPWETSREFARIHAYIDGLIPPSRGAVNAWRRITSERVAGGVRFTWRLVWLVKA